MTGRRFGAWLRRRRTYREALELIARGGCENYVGGLRCWQAGRLRGAHYTAEAWCLKCIAQRALDGEHV